MTADPEFEHGIVSALTGRPAAESAALPLPALAQRIEFAQAAPSLRNACARMRIQAQWFE